MFSQNTAMAPGDSGPDVISLIVSKLCWESQHVMDHNIIRLLIQYQYF